MHLLKNENQILKANNLLYMTNENDIKANAVVNFMMQHDLFSQWMGIELLEIKVGYSKT